MRNSSAREPAPRSAEISGKRTMPLAAIRAAITG